MKRSPQESLSIRNLWMAKRLIELSLEDLKNNDFLRETEHWRLMRKAQADFEQALREIDTVIQSSKLKE